MIFVCRDMYSLIQTPDSIMLANCFPIALLPHPPSPNGNGMRPRCYDRAKSGWTTDSETGIANACRERPWVKVAPIVSRLRSPRMVVCWGDSVNANFLLASVCNGAPVNTCWPCNNWRPLPRQLPRQRSRHLARMDRLSLPRHPRRMSLDLNLTKEVSHADE
uniref:Uncharacterized protein n=1 Tax=Cyanothece sp. (strain PCC 7425 / ATCC 29141) TaxID=395961 RepID=B8HJV8_CYAP4